MAITKTCLPLGGSKEGDTMSSENMRDAFRTFTTTCALITTDGPRGPNVMAAEWAFNVSYDPFLILVAIDPANRTHDMILESKEFGVNLVSEDQVAAMGFAGHYSKEDTDKLSSELFDTYPGKKIRAPMIRNALLQAECRLVQTHVLGDHTAFVGEVLEFSVAPEGKPVALHHGSRRLGERIARPPGLVVAVTPMQAKPGTGLEATGELTGPGRAGQTVEVWLRDPAGNVVAKGEALTDDEGGFRSPLELPDSTPAGRYHVEARSGGLTGRAHLEISN